MRSRTYRRPGSRSRKSKSPRKPKRKVGSRSKKRKSHPTKPWAKISPKKGHERKQLKERCGSKCFLDAKKLKYPICTSYRSGSSKNCKPDCRGILSALVRARQWKHNDVAKKAERLYKKYSCGSKSKRSR